MSIGSEDRLGGKGDYSRVVGTVMERGELAQGSEDQSGEGRRGSLGQRGEMSPRNSECRVGLTSILVVLILAGGVRALHKEDGIDEDGGVASSIPRGHQWHLEVDPVLAQRDETDGHHAGQAQHQAQLVTDLLGLMQQPPAHGQLGMAESTPVPKPAADCPLPVSALSPATQPSHPRSSYQTLSPQV